MKSIDENIGKNSYCDISMNNITNFKWDKMLIFDLGSSNDEISKALGVKYNDSVDLVRGLIFVYNNKIVYSEQFHYNPEKSYKLRFHIDNKPGEDNFWVLSPDNSILIGNKMEVDGVTFYEIKPQRIEK